LTRAAQVINNATFRPFLIFSIVALIYFLMCWPLSLYSQRMEKKLSAAAR
jgi:polar amino acid transport system permease protein